jgi:hypothetical protein
MRPDRLLTFFFLASRCVAVALLGWYISSNPLCSELYFYRRLYTKRMLFTTLYMYITLISFLLPLVQNDKGDRRWNPESFVDLNFIHQSPMCGCCSIDFVWWIHFAVTRGHNKTSEFDKGAPSLITSSLLFRDPFLMSLGPSKKKKNEKWEKKKKERKR